jgi:hypothetical protein
MEPGRNVAELQLMTLLRHLTPVVSSVSEFRNVTINADLLGIKLSAPAVGVSPLTLLLVLMNALSANMEFEPRLLSLINLLVSKFSDYDGTPVEVTNWFRCFVFDVMGALALNKTYGSIENGKLYPGIQDMQDFIWAEIMIGQVPWLACTLSQIPGLPDPAADLKNFCIEGLKDRAKVNTQYFYWYPSRHTAHGVLSKPPRFLTWCLVSSLEKSS